MDLGVKIMLILNGLMYAFSLYANIEYEVKRNNNPLPQHQGKCGTNVPKV
jgi:hypothetical protein